MSESAQPLPKKGDNNWQEYIFSFFKEDELHDNHPTCYGLRRVCENVYGEIIKCVTQVVHAPSSMDRSATVICEIICREHETNLIVVQNSSADVNEDNTNFPFNQHPVATAETRAEGRALKRLLCLNCHTYEEMSGENAQMKGHYLQNTKVRAIKNLTKRLEINLEKFLAKEVGCGLEALEPGPNAIPDKVAQYLIDLINGYYDKSIPMPDDIKTTSSKGSE